MWKDRWVGRVLTRFQAEPEADERVTHPVWTPEAAALVDHPALGHLSAVVHQLQLMVAALTAAHAGNGAGDPLTVQARSMVLTATVLQGQVTLYRQLLEARQMKVGPPGNGQRRR